MISQFQFYFSICMREKKKRNIILNGERDFELEFYSLPAGKIVQPSVEAFKSHLTSFLSIPAVI